MKSSYEKNDEITVWKVMIVNTCIMQDYEKCYVMNVDFNKLV